MSWVRLVWLEEDGEKESTVPSVWVERDTLRWPSKMNVTKTFQSQEPPESNWFKYRIVKEKIRDDDFWLCENYNFTSNDDDDDCDKIMLGDGIKNKKRSNKVPKRNNTLTYPTLAEKSSNESTPKADSTKRKFMEAPNKAHFTLPGGSSQVTNAFCSDERSFLSTQYEKENVPTKKKKSSIGSPQVTPVECCSDERSFLSSQSLSYKKEKVPTKKKKSSIGSPQVTPVESCSDERSFLSSQSLSYEKENVPTRQKKSSSIGSPQLTPVEFCSDESSFLSSQSLTDKKGNVSTKKKESSSTADSLKKKKHGKKLDFSVNSKRGSPSEMPKRIYLRKAIKKKCLGSNQGISPTQRKSTTLKQGQNFNKQGPSNVTTTPYDEDIGSKSDVMEAEENESVGGGVENIGSTKLSKKKFPLPESRYQYKSLHLLTEIRDGIKEILTLLRADASLQLKAFDSFQEFEEFDKSLANDKDAYKAVKTHLTNVGGATCHANVRAMLMKLMTNNLMTMFSLAGKGDKQSFRETNLIKIVKGCAANSYTEKEVEEAIGKILIRAPDRKGGGGRKKRKADQPTVNDAKNYQNDASDDDEDDYDDDSNDDSEDDYTDSDD